MIHHIFKLAARHGHKVAKHGSKAHKVVKTTVRAPITPHKALWTQSGKIARHKIPPGI